MPDFNVRSDSVNVEQIMEQIRARIREKRGTDYTEQQIHDLANVKLERFLDPRGVRSDLLDQFRRAQPPYSPPDLPNYAFEEATLFESHRGPLRLIRRLLQPVLKLFFNPNPLVQALNIQARLNTLQAEREARNEAARHTFDSLHYEVLHNLVVETTRMGIEVKNLKMRVESLTSRLEFNERRARALESVVVYKPSPEDRQDTAPRETRDSREARGTREAREARDTREPRGPSEPREVRDTREPISPREPGEGHDTRGPREPLDVRQFAATPETRAEEPQARVDDGAPPNADAAPQEGPGQRSRRRRRRRGRRGGGSAAAILAAPQPGEPGALEAEHDGARGSGPIHTDQSGASASEPESSDRPDPGDSDPSDREP